MPVIWEGKHDPPVPTAATRVLLMISHNGQQPKRERKRNKNSLGAGLGCRLSRKKKKGERKRNGGEDNGSDRYRNTICGHLHVFGKKRKKKKK